MNKKILSQLFFSVLIFSSCLAYAGKEGDEGKEKTEEKVEDNQNAGSQAQQNADSLERPGSQAQQNADDAADSPQDVKNDQKKEEPEQKKEEPEQKTLIQNPIPQKASSTNIVLGNLDTKKEFAHLIQSPHFLMKVLSFVKDSRDFISLAQTNRAINQVICSSLSDSKEHFISELRNRLNPEHPGQISSFNLFRGSLMARNYFLIPAPQYIGYGFSADPDRKHFIRKLLEQLSGKEPSREESSREVLSSEESSSEESSSEEELSQKKLSREASSSEEELSQKELSQKKLSREASSEKELSEKETSFPHICKRSLLVFSISTKQQLDFLNLLSDTDYSSCALKYRHINYAQQIADLGLPLVTSEVSLLENTTLLPQIVQFVCTLGSIESGGRIIEGIFYKRFFRNFMSRETNIQKVINIVNQNNIQVSLKLIRPSQDQIPLLKEFFKTKKIAELQADYLDLVDDNGCRFDLSFVRSFQIAPLSEAELEQVLPLLSEQAKHLQILDIGELVTDEQFYDAIEAFAQNSPIFPHLQELKCPIFGEEDLETDSFFRLFPSKLRHLNLGMNSGLTAAQVKSAVEHFDKLESLSFALGVPDEKEDYLKHIALCMNNFFKYEKSLTHLKVTFDIPLPTQNDVTQELEIPKILITEQSTEKQPAIEQSSAEQSATKKWLFSNIQTLDFNNFIPGFYASWSQPSEQGVYNFASLENVKTVIELCNPESLSKISFGSEGLVAKNLPFLEKMIEPLSSKVLIVCEDLDLSFEKEKKKKLEERKNFYQGFLEKYPRLTAQMRIAGRTLAEHCSRALKLK